MKPLPITPLIVCAWLIAVSRASGGVPCGATLPACPADFVPAGGDGQINVSELLAVINEWGVSGPPRPLADIAPAPAGDCVVNVSDLLVVIGTWGTCVAPTGACLTAESGCQILTQSQCAVAEGLGWVQGASCLDSDNDRLPNAFELNDCSVVNGAFAGTSPIVADSDGDNIKDGDEVLGTVNGLNLPALGSNPLRKNLFMEVDWTQDALGGVHEHRPPAAAVTALINAFAAAPVSNPCGPTGITLIVDFGQGGAFTGGTMIGTDEVVLFDSEFNAYKAANFASNRNGYFYYAIHCHRYNSGTNNSSGVAELNGDDHIVSVVGSWASVSAVSKTMMHEFGHNLGLRHGGNENLNYKPNYNSVMNYRYQFPGADSNCNASGDGVLNYSLGVNIALDENALLEAAGVCGTGAIDWNGDGQINPAPIVRNVNCSAGVTGACGVDTSGCADQACGTLNDHNDWLAIVFTGLNHADFAPPEIIHCEAPQPRPLTP